MIADQVYDTRYGDATWWREAADILTCLYKPSFDEVGPAMETLDDLMCTLREGPIAGPDAERSNLARWQRAKENYRRAADLADRLRRRGGSDHYLEGLLPMCEGALEHARGYFAAANQRYAEAASLWSNNHRHNWAVAILAQALACLRQGLKDQIPEVGDALRALRASEFGRTAIECWQAAQKAYEQRMAAPPSPTPQTPVSSDADMVDNETGYGHARWQDVQTPDAINARLIRILAVVAIIVALLGAGFVIGIGQAWIGLLAYILAFVAAVLGRILIVVFEKPVEIPDLCVALIEGPMGITVRVGPVSYRGWPFLQKVRAIVPLNAYNYVSSKQKVVLSSEASVEISLAVRYRVRYYGLHPVDQRHSISRSVNAVRDQLVKPGVHRREPWRPDDLRTAWQSKLRDDIRMTFYQSLPLLGNPKHIDQERKAVESRLKVRLQDKVDDWGIEILGVWIAELNEIK